MSPNPPNPQDKLTPEPKLTTTSTPSQMIAATNKVPDWNPNSKGNVRGQDKTYSPDKKWIGKNYQTPDLMAKVLGQAKYAEDFRAEGMLFCKLLLSPVPHGRVRGFDLTKALAMPGVKAIITADDVPPIADSLTDNGTVIKASKWGERALTNEPVYHGEPILAVAAVDEWTAAMAIEAITVDIEPLPFVVDPLDSLRPGGPNPRTDGNVWARPETPKAVPGQPPPRPPDPIVTQMKWSDEDFKTFQDGKLPLAKAPETWEYGDLEAGFKKADLILDETFQTADVSHICLEPRTAMAYWQNGKVYVHSGTQSTAQTLPAIGRWLHMDVKDVVFISEYTGGGFGSKITGGVTMIIPALLSKKANAPVMMRLTREEETLVGRARPAIIGRCKIGFTKDGRITAVDYYSLCNGGSYDAQNDGGSSARIISLLYTAPAMRWRGVSAITNTPPRAAMSAPGGLQGIAIFDPFLSKAARKLGLDQVAIRNINAPEGKALIGPAVNGKRPYVTSCFLKDALAKGAEQFQWSKRVSLPKRSATKARGIGVAISTYNAGSVGFDGLIVITPEGKFNIHCGIGNLGTENFSDVNRVVAETLDMDWNDINIIWGNTSKHLPYSCVSGGSQTTNAMTRAALAVAQECKKQLQEVAAKTHGGSPESHKVSRGRVGGMTYAEAAQAAIKLGGKYDGHEVDPGLNRVTKTSAAAVAGTGLVAAAKDNFAHDGAYMSYAAQFAEVEVDLETGKYHVTDFLTYADVGTVMHPRALGGQVLGRTTLGIAHAISQKWVFDPNYGIMVAKRMYQNRPPTILDVPVDMQWSALDTPDPESPIGARGIGEPPVGGGAAAILSALADAVGDDVFQRAPVNSDTILLSLENKKPMQHPLMAHI